MKGRLLLMMMSAIGCSLGASSLAHAGSGEEDLDTYERHDRTRYETPQRFALELRFGPYVPQIDKEFPQAKPFQQTFGDGKGFYFGLEFDWQALRIPYVGSFGPAFSWGYTHRSAPAKLSAQPTVDSAEQTYLTIMPMYLAGVLRVDVLAREVSIPLVPYAKVGLGLGLWSTSTDNGTSVRDGVLGRGRSWGPHIALGAMLLLDAFDESAARQLDTSVGINHTYAYVEWMRNSLDGLSFLDSHPQMHVGTSTWVLGLAFEM